MNTVQILGFGGGVQTIAMCVLVVQGILERPDYLLMADTGREVQSTFDYLEQHMQPLLDTVGLHVDIASHDLATVDLYAHNGDLLMPVYTSTGKLQTYCSNEWKQRVSQRWLRAHGVTSAVTWLGFSLDEQHRAKAEKAGPWTNRYPLLELMLTRENCKQIITRAGLPIPQKSACYMCPHRTNSEWRDVRDQHPAQWQQAITIDSEVREADERGAVYLHKSRQPLALADLDAPDGLEKTQCGLGGCWT